MILNIETSANVCSVALSKDGKLIDTLESYEPNSHSRLLTLFIQEIVKKNGISFEDLKAIAVSEGPGSYTGLRIGVSTAKGLAYSLGIPMIAIDTLRIMCIGALSSGLDIETINPILCPMIDARRMEVYTAFYDSALNKISETSNLIIDKYSFQTPLQYRQIVFFGNGAEKCKDTITHPNAIFLDNIVALSKNMVKLSFEKFKNKVFVDVAYFEPFYLKPFIATVAKDKLKS